MKFKLDVQNKRIKWPTQNRFDRLDWEKHARVFCEDEVDDALVQTGVWIADTLDIIRREIDSLTIWSLPSDMLSQCVLGLCNRDYATLNQLLQPEVIFNKQKRFISVIAEESLRDSLTQEILGSRKISDLAETPYESANRLLDASVNSSVSSKDPRRLFTDLIRAMNCITAYQVVEDAFQEALWLDWCVQDSESAWLLFPLNFEEQKKWDASWRRFAELMSQEGSLTNFIWGDMEPIVRSVILNNFDQSGVPKFALGNDKGLVKVTFERMTIPSYLPRIIDNELIATKEFYLPLLEEPLKASTTNNILDLLRIYSLLGDIAEQIGVDYPIQSEIDTLEGLTQFCPIVLRKPLVTALAQATSISENEVSTLLKLLIKSPKNKISLWFRPLVQVSTNKGPGYLFATLPLVAPNIYRLIEHWITSYGLTIERRGALFEQQILVELQAAAKQGKYEDDVVIIKPGELISADGNSREEIDILLLLYDLIVVIEAKCQTLPTTATDLRNYSERLRDGAKQAVRKARWVEKNKEVIAKKIIRIPEKLSGRVVPIVVSNHPVGAGLSLNDVPILDLLLLKNYLSRPYRVGSYLTAEGYEEYQKSEHFYITTQEMASKFEEYTRNPFFLNAYTTLLEENWIDFFVFRDKPLKKFQYQMNTSKVDSVL